MPKELAKKAKPSPLVIGIDTEYQGRQDIAQKNYNDLLSYQAFLYDRDTGLTFSYINKPKKNARGKYPRWTLGEFLGKAVHEAIKKRVISECPQSIIVTGHFLRADLSMFADFHTSLKRKLAAVHGTYVTTKRRLPLQLILPDGARRVTLAVVDTMLIAPPKSKLADIGDYVGLPKIEIMGGYSIEEMERFREEQPEAFDEYAIRDAEIAARYAVSIFNLFAELGISGIKVTLGSAGVAMFKNLFANKAEWKNFLGHDPDSSGEVGRPLPTTALLSGFAASAYHGGLNSIYHVGYSPIGRDVFDIDLSGAYTTALAAMGWPDWDSTRQTTSLADLAVIDDAMTFALVKFQFPPGPTCLPIRSGDAHGLIYPHGGESWCCGPELRLALDMGCAVTVIHGFRVDWIPRRANPFATFGRNIAIGRKAAKAARDIMRGLGFKLLGNTVYGKIAQGVSSKRLIADDVSYHKVFDAETGEMEDLPPSSITCAAIAAWATAFVRAAMIEMMHRMPPTAIVRQATTDGILFDGVESDISVAASGPVMAVYRRARAFIDDDLDPNVLEIKHLLPRALPFKTRGLISVVPEDWTGDVHLAKAGAHFPPHLKTEVESTRYAEQLYRERTYETTYTRKDLTSLSEQYKTGSDLTATTRAIRLNWDFDFKNEPIESTVADVEGVISFATRPWRNIKVFETRRKEFEDWQRSQRRSLKTARDYFDFVEWAALRPMRKLVRTRSDGILPNLARVIAAEAMRRPWNERPSYTVIAEALARATGKPITKHTIQDIRRRRDRIPHQCLGMLSADDIAFARVYGANPVAIEQLRSAILPGSIAERQLADALERRLPAPLRQLAPPEPEPGPAPALETDHVNGFDYFRIFDDRRRLLVPNVGHDEARFRAIEYTVNFCRSKLGIDFEAAKSTVLEALRAA